MKFFIPGASSAEDSEKIYQGIRQFVAGQVGPIMAARIYRIQFSHDGGRFNLKVGDIHPQLNEPVVAILEGGIYYICTPNRGVVRGTPYMVGRHYDTAVEFFEEAAIAASAAENI